jgi:hypothetical protein
MKNTENLVAVDGGKQMQERAEELETSGCVFKANVLRYVSFAELPEIVKWMRATFEDDVEIKIEGFWKDT